MQLSQYIDDKHIETVQVAASSVHIIEAKTELLKKYKAELKTCRAYHLLLEPLPSAMNHFRSLLD